MAAAAGAEEAALAVGEAVEEEAAAGVVVEAAAGAEVLEATEVLEAPGVVAPTEEREFEFRVASST